MSSSGLNLENYLIPLDEIKRATLNFSQERCIGGGGFGAVYKGKLSKRWQNRTAAIKRLSRGSYQGEHEFRNELEMISKFHHENIISFIGYCDEDKEMIIVYDYAINGSLDHHLQDPNKMSCITWKQRLKICIGAARGLDYLHSGLGEHDRVIHRDVKSANILLDDNLVAKVCDFGLSRSGLRNLPDTQVNTKVAGTPYYVDPAYHESRILRKESDVYSFGVVLFEMMSGMLVYSERSINYDRPEQLMTFVRECNHNDLHKLTDPHIKDQIDIRSFDTFTKIAYECISFDFKERPRMDMVIEKLEEALNIQETDEYTVNLDMEEIGFFHGLRDFAVTIYKLLLLHRKDFPAKRTPLFDKLVKFVEPDDDGRDYNDKMAYWLSHACTLLFLIQRSLKLQGARSVTKPPPTTTPLERYKMINDHLLTPPIATAVTIHHHLYKETMSSSGVNLEKYLIPLDEINRATENFNQERCIGGGGFGLVYKGQLSEHWQNRIVAVKRLGRDSHQGDHEFRNELEIISKFHHENIISFIGYCDEDKEMIIVYEYATNGSLDHHLQDPNKMSCITWTQRLKICIGAARGLDYLHSGLQTHNRVIHRDVKSANILLDDNLVAKICDFGLSRSGIRFRPNTQVYTKVAGTPFYVDPAYHESRILRKESDVYSFGVVLFEMLSGMLVYSERSINADRPEQLMTFVRKYDHNDLHKLTDPHIRDQIDIRSFDTFTKMAYECINFNFAVRPRMDMVIEKLEETLNIQEIADSTIEFHMEDMVAERTTVFDQHVQAFQPENDGQDNNDKIAYWLSHACTSLFLIQRSLKLQGARSVLKPPPLPTSLETYVMVFLLFFIFIIYIYVPWVRIR